MKIIDRNKAIADSFLSGVPGTVLGKQYGLSRERVRQILQMYNINKDQGGQCISAKRKQEERLNEYNAKWMPKWGCTKAQYNLIPHIVRRGFKRQKDNAKTRGIGFRLTLLEWVQIWKDSGHLHERGRSGHVMARNGDSGDYEMGNVRIIKASENLKEARQFKKWKWGRKEKARCPRGHIKDKISPRGYGYCSICGKIAQAKYKAKWGLAI